MIVHSSLAEQFAFASEKLPRVIVSFLCLSQENCPELNAIRPAWEAQAVHRLMEWFGLAGTDKEHVAQTPFHRQDHLSQDQVAQRPI